MAEVWIGGHETARAHGEEFAYAITRANDGVLVGALGVRPHANEHGHFGYWVGKAYWGCGYATAATRVAIALLFARTDLDALWAVHLADNAGSALVMDKCGMTMLRQETRDHRGEPRDHLVRGITREAWEAQRG